MIRVNAFFRRSHRLRTALVGITLAALTVVVQAQVFSAPQNVSHSGTAEFAQIAVDSSGNISVVWDDFTPGNNDIFFSRSADGGVTFSSPKNVSNNPGSSVFPQVSVDSAGNINVVWEDNTPGNFDIFFSRSTNGGVTFSTPKNLSNDRSSNGAQVAVDSTGNINVVWDDFTPGNNDIFFSRSADGGVSFSVPRNISNSAGASLFPGVDAATNHGNIAVDSSGNINVVWDDFTPGSPDIFFTRSTDGGATFSTPKNISSNVGSSVSSQVAVDSSGNINVVWVDNTPGNAEIFFSRSNDGGVTFSTPKNLSNNAGLSGSPEEIVDSGGNINVVWVDNTPGNFDIFFTRSTDGGTTFSTPQNLSNDAIPSGDAQIAVDSTGNINVVWDNQTSGGFAGSAVLFANSTDGGASFSTPKNLSSNAFQPQIAVGPGGGINVIWDNFTFPPISSDIFYRGSGEAILGPVISVSPTQITFPPTVLNTSSSPVPVTISNIGKVNLVVSGISTQDPFFIINPSSNIPGTLSPNTQGTFDVIFKPTTEGTSFGGIEIDSNAANLPSVNISLTGTGSPPPLPTGAMRVFVSWTAGQILEFVLLKETNTTANTQVQFQIANLQPAWYDVAVSTVGQVSGSLPVDFVLGPNEVKADFPTITFSPGAAIRFTADRTTNQALTMLGVDFFWRAVRGSAFPVTESDRAITFLEAQDQASAMLLRIGHDIENNDITALISDGLAAIGNQQVLTTLRALGLTIGTKATLIATIINNSAQALSALVLELLSPPSENLFVTAQR